MSKKINQESFHIIGIEARTNNAAEMGPHGIIPQQWERFMKENLFAKIPHKTDSAIIAAYTEYQSNKDGEYTFFIGAKVNSDATAPEGMVLKHIPKTDYLVLSSQKGPIWEVVQGLWKKIWTLPASEVGSEASRAYGFDYEVYDGRASDPMNAQVDVYLGIKFI